MGLRTAWQALWRTTERRDILSTDPRLEALLGGYRLTGGQVVNTHTAQNLATVLACVSAISSAIASLPVWVYRRTGAGRAVDAQHPLMRLHREGVNQFQTWPDLVEWLIASTLLSGNGLAEIQTDGRGELIGLRAIPWSWSAVQLLPNGRLAYDVSEQIGLFGTTGRTKRLLGDQVLHLRDRSDDGVLGISRLRRAAGVVAAAIGIQEFSAGALAHGTYPSGVVQAEGLLNAPAFEALQNRFKAFSGAQGVARALVLDQGLKWARLTVSPEDMELLGARRFTVEELARLFGVPPNIVGDLTNSSFTNSETMVRLFATSCLAPWCRKLEAAIAQQIFTGAERSTHLIEFDLSALLRADPETRWASHKIAVEAGILTPNEVREIEGFDPRPGGDAPPAAPQ
jgi:HK97 family phage portal protein